MADAGAETTGSGRMCSVVVLASIKFRALPLHEFPGARRDLGEAPRRGGTPMPTIPARAANC